MTVIFFDTVKVTSQDSTTSRVMLGVPVGGLNEGVTTAQQGLLVPSVAPQTSLPQLTATAYLNGVPLSPQPNFLWESSNPCCCAVDQNGNCTRVSNPQASSFDSNGCVSTGQLGGLVQITATALRPDGSPSGVRGVIDIVVQAQAARQFGGPSQNGGPGADNAPSSTGFYNLVE
ncbi:MAG TPA: hypothetical protein VGG14_16640 [Candidatus Sulfotelmatobacter sp.]|jgi:hypothetical protein